MPKSSDRSVIDIRRLVVLLIGIVALAIGLASTWQGGGQAVRSYASNSAFRIGVVMIALWLALPTLNKPMRWLPPGAALLCLLVIGAIAAQPKLLVILIPLGGFLLSTAWLVRLLRARRPGQ